MLCVFERDRIERKINNSPIVCANNSRTGYCSTKIIQQFAEKDDLFHNEALVAKNSDSVLDIETELCELDYQCVGDPI